MNLKPLHEQVVVIFGASSGIGREAALRFARRGAKVVVSARSEEGLNSLVDEIRRLGDTAVAVPAEATDFEQVKAVAERAVSEFGRLDTWVHLAAVAVYATFDQLTPEEFKRVIDVNLTGQSYGAMAALPHLKRSGGGALIHISSVEGKRALPYHSAYAASKHGIVGMLDAMRVELMREGAPVSVTNIMPASINTPFFNKARTKLGVKPQGMPPIYQPQLVADAILYAAENPVRDIVVGGAGKAMIAGQMISPKLMDAYMLRNGFAAQRTNELKSEDAPDNLFEPMQGQDRIEGDFGHMAKQQYSYNRSISGSSNRTGASSMQTALVGAALGAAAMLLFGGNKQQQQKPRRQGPRMLAEQQSAWQETRREGRLTEAVRRKAAQERRHVEIEEFKDDERQPIEL